MSSLDRQRWGALLRTETVQHFVPEILLVDLSSLLEDRVPPPTAEGATRAVPKHVTLPEVDVAHQRSLPWRPQPFLIWRPSCPGTRQPRWTSSRWRQWQQARWSHQLLVSSQILSRRPLWHQPLRLPRPHLQPQCWPVLANCEYKQVWRRCARGRYGK